MAPCAGRALNGVAALTLLRLGDALRSDRDDRNSEDTDNEKRAAIQSFANHRYSYLAIDIVVAPEMGTIKCAYGVPFHITQGPPFFGSVEKASSTFTSW